MTPVPEGVDRRSRLLILAALWLFVVAVLITFREVVMPFAAAALLAFLIAPLLSRLTALSFRGRHLPRWVAILLVYALFFGVVWIFSIAVLPQLYRELARISKGAVAFANSPERIQDLVRTADGWLSEHGFPVALSSRALEGSDAEMAGSVPRSLNLNLEDGLHDAILRASQLVQENLGNIVTVSRNIVAGVFAGVFMTFFMLMVAAFFSIDAEAIRSYCGTLVPSELRADARVLVARIERSLAGVVRGQVTICLINGTLTFAGLMVFGVKFAFVLATVATVFSLIPIFGTILSSVPIVLIALSQGWQAGLGMLLWIVGIHALEAYFLNPKVMGSAARIHPVVVAFALIAGERSFGLVGALFAVPLAAIVVASFDFAREKAQAAPEAALPAPEPVPAAAPVSAPAPVPAAVPPSPHP